MTNCKPFFGLDDSFFEERSCLNTASEIAGQPFLWRKLAEELTAKQEELAAFMQRLGDLSRMRIILTGAGSSAFVGEALASFVAKSAAIKCEAIHTTDIVSAPETILFPDLPTMIVSFARSGNSPESIGVVQHARKRIKTLYEVAIVCEKDSQLYRVTDEAKNKLILLMPDGTNDKGFAMTASVTCMLMAGFALFHYSHIDEIAQDINRLADNVDAMGPELSRIAETCAKKSFYRAVYLGCGAYKGLMHEGCLKMMELTNGAVNASYDSATGFRHGPKTVIKNDAISLHFISSDPFTAKYDLDLLNEMTPERDKNLIFALCEESAAGAVKNTDGVVKLAGGYGFAAHLCIGVSGVVFMQTLALHKSLALGITTDNPSPGGQVNRVVKGVTVYPL